MRGLPPERVTWHLDNWAQWQRERASDYLLGNTWHAGSGARSNRSRDLNEMVSAVDDHCAKVTDVVIHDLPPLQEYAVRHYHCVAVFRSIRAPMSEPYRRARDYIALQLERRGIWY